MLKFGNGSIFYYFDKTLIIHQYSLVLTRSAAKNNFPKSLLTNRPLYQLPAPNKKTCLFPFEQCPFYPLIVKLKQLSQTWQPGQGEENQFNVMLWLPEETFAHLAGNLGFDNSPTGSRYEM